MEARALVRKFRLNWQSVAKAALLPKILRTNLRISRHAKGSSPIKDASRSSVVCMT